MHFFIPFIVNIISLILILLLNDKDVKDYSGLFFGIQYLFVFLHTYSNNHNKTLDTYLRPSFLIHTYTSFYFIFGSFYANAGFGFFKEMLRVYSNIENFKISILFLFICNYIVFAVGEQLYRKKNKVLVRKRNKQKISPILIFFSILLFILFYFIELDLTSLGGAGSFSYIPKLVFAIFLFIYLSSEKIKLRLIYYAVILVFFALSSYQSKREIIFVLISIIFIENYFNPIPFKLNIKSFLKIISVLGISLLFILSSSIQRGYGNYGASNLSKSISYIPEYIRSDIFLDAIGDNLELNFVYINAINATDLFLSGKQGVLYGETFLKAIFIIIPRSLFGYKPNSMIWLYSPNIDVKDEMITSPVIYYAELLWNFSLFFPFFLIVLTYLMDKLFFVIYSEFNKGINFKLLTLLVWFTINLQFVRGSGLDLLFLYLLISIPFIYSILFVKKYF